MDITLARTFLTVAETGSFIDAARRINCTQSTVSARIKNLEDQLGQPLFERSKTGAALTPAGQQFRKHALALVRVWRHAQLEIGLSEEHRDHLSIGAVMPLWDGFLVRWVAWMRDNIPDIAVTATSGMAPALTQRLVEGTLDMAVMYQPAQPPGFVLEHLFDEELVKVSTAGNARHRSDDYVHIDWGPDFQSDHASAYPEMPRPGLNLDLGTLGLSYLLQGQGSAYFPARLVKPYLNRGRLKLTRRARRFVYPVFMLYPEARDEEAYEPILEGLRQSAWKLAS